MLARQATAVRDALKSLRHEAEELGENTLPAAQRAALDEELRRDEDACVAALEDALTMAEQQVAIKRGVQQASSNARDEWMTTEAATHTIQPGLETLPATDKTMKQEPPVALREGLDETVRSMRALVYSARPPQAEAMQGKVASDPRVSALQSRWASWSERTKAPTVMDPNEMTQWIMRQAYIDNSADMRAYAIKIQFQTTLKGIIRDELNRAREARSTLAKGSNNKDKSLSSPFFAKKDPARSESGRGRQLFRSTARGRRRDCRRRRAQRLYSRLGNGP